MRLDGISLIEGSQITNLTVATGTSFPSSANAGELFYRTDESALYSHNGTTWAVVGSGGAGGAAAAGDLTGTTLASGVTASSLTSVGTLSALAVTGTTTQTGPLNLAGVLSPLQVQGSAGTSGYVLTSAGAGVTPTWSAPAPAGVVGTTTQVAFNNAGTMSGSADLTFSGQTLSIGVDTNTNTARLNVTGLISSGVDGGNNSALTIRPAVLAGNEAGHTLTIIGGTSNRAGGSVTITGGAESTNGYGAGGVFITGGGGFGGTGYAGSVTISGGVGAAAQGAITLKTADTIRLQVTGTGAWSVGTNGTSYGTAGQVLTSNGNAAPTWQAAGGGGTATTATNLAGGSANRIPYQSAADTTAFGGLLSTASGNVIVASDIAGTTIGGALTLGAPAAGIANLLTLANTYGQAPGEGVGISFVDNTTAAAGFERASIHMLVEGSPFNGAIKFSTGLGTPGTYNAGTMAERMRITGSGGISFGATGTAYGTSGQVLTSNGNAAPTWQTLTAAAAAAGDLTGNTLASGVTASSLTSVGTLSALAVTGTTTQTGALNLAGASSPLQVGGSAGTSGYVLTSAGAGNTPTWSAPAGIDALDNVLVVAKNGNDTTGNGSFGTPFLTIQKAHDYAAATFANTDKVSIMVAPATYNENLNITRLRTQIIGMGSSMNNDGATVIGACTIAPTAGIVNFNADAVTFINLLLAGVSSVTNPVLTLAGGTVSYTFSGENLKIDTSNATAKGINVTNTSTAGIKVKLNRAFIQITGGGTCIALSNAYLALLNDCEVYANSGSAITSATSALVINRGTLATVSGANVLTVTSGFGGGTAATIGTTSFTNSAANGDGINIASGATAVVGTCAFSIGTTAGTGRAIKGVSGSVLLTAFNTIIPGTNAKKSSAIGAGDVPMGTALTAA